jgi:hypothetical protein
MMLYRDLSLFLSIFVLLGHYIYFACAYQRKKASDIYPVGCSVLLPIIGGLDDLSF